MDNQFEQSKLADGAHHRLAQLTGEWFGMTKTWFEPDVLADESEWRGVIRPLLDGRFILHEYEGSLLGEPLRGYCLIGYDLGKQKYQATWIDHFHMGTAMMHLEGDPTESGFSMQGKWMEWSSVTEWGWRIEVSVLSADDMVITMYNITPQGEEAKGVETIYRRAG